MKKRARIVILVVLDTLRADHVGCYGYHLPTTPHLDQFAKEATLYRHAFSTCSYTVPAHASLFTGKYPSNHSIFFQQLYGKLNTARDITIAEILRSHHFQTAAFVSSSVLNKELLLSSGFDIYDDHMTKHEANRTEALIRDGYETNRAFFEFLKNNPSERGFYFLHYFDIHGPYGNGKKSNTFPLSDYGENPEYLKKVPDGFPGGIPEYQLLGVKKDAKGNITGYEKDRRYYLSQYDGGIRYTDGVLGELFHWLRKNKIYETALIIITADHGEALGENDIHFFHGLNVTLDQIKVPLLIKYPNMWQEGKIQEYPVTHVDLFPTILNWAGIDSKGFCFDGIDLNKEEENFLKRWIISENQWQRAIVRGRYVLLSPKKITYSIPGYYWYPISKMTEGEAFFDYVTDPICKNNIIAISPEINKFLLFKSFLETFVDPKEETIAERDTDLQHVLRELKQARITADSISHSLSWRLTRPLRWGYGKVLRLIKTFKNWETQNL